MAVIARHVCRDGTEVEFDQSDVVRNRVKCPHCGSVFGESLLVWREKDPFRDA